MEQKYDDGVARLYRAIEVLAQIELKRGLSELIPQTLGRNPFLPAFVRVYMKYREKNEGKIKIPLYASYVLMKELGSPLAKEFFNIYEKEIRSLLDIRNSSILAHGFQSC